MLDLEQCPEIDDDRLLDMVKTMPKLRIINYYGHDVEPRSAQKKQIEDTCIYDEETACG